MKLISFINSCHSAYFKSFVYFVHFFLNIKKRYLYNCDMVYIVDLYHAVDVGPNKLSIQWTSRSKL